MKVGALALWGALMLLWVVFAAAMPHVGVALLHHIHFDHPDPDHRARALAVRALHQWEEGELGMEN